MRLSRLELFGFKSFLHRTVLHFGEGITSIVGPNGCGKSNIVDAIIWALGERGTKPLRVKEMGDVIFHGSNGKRPVNIAEVVVAFQEEAREYEIKRKIFRDGENEYYMNGVSVRLKDIQDFLLGTGIGLNTYAIVEQGKVEYFTQMKPQERKVLVEEASGITRFEEKKREAIIRLEEVKANLERVGDISNEVANSLKKAEMEWTRWRRYKSLTDRLAEIDRQMLVDGLKRLNKRIEKVVEKREAIGREIEAKEVERKTLKEEVELKTKELSLTDEAIRELELYIRGKEKDMENRLIEIEYIKEEKGRLEAAKKRSEEQLVRLLKRIADEEEATDRLSKELEELNAAIKRLETEALSSKQAIEGLRVEIDGYEKAVEEERVRLFVIMSSIADIKNRISEIERQEQERFQRSEKRRKEEQSIRQRLEALEEKGDSIKERQAGLKTKHEGMIAERERLFKEREVLSFKIENVRARIVQLKAERAGKEAFLKQMAIYEEAGKERTEGDKRLIDLIRADETIEKALESHFSRELRFKVIEETDIEAITEKVKGWEDNYIFFSENGVFKRRGAEIEVDVKVIDGIEDALKRIKEGEEGIFLNEKVYIDSRGYILHKNAAKRIDIKRFKEQKRVEVELEQIRAALKGLEVELNRLETARTEIERSWKKVRRDADEMDRTIKAQEHEVALIETEKKALEQAIKGLDTIEDIHQLPQETLPFSKEGLYIDLSREEEKRKGSDARIASLKEILERLKKGYEGASSRWHEATITLERQTGRFKAITEDIKEKGQIINNLNGEIEANKARVEEIEGEIQKQTERLNALEGDYEGLKRDCSACTIRYEELKALSGNLHMERAEIQKGIDRNADEIERQRVRREGIEKELAVLIEKRGQILERLRETYGIEDIEGHQPISGVDLEKERETILSEIAGLGEVNLRAEKEYMELKERATFLERQMEDLRGSMESLKKTISKIDGLSKEIFLETFNKVDESFKRFAYLLFKGGKGHLALNPETNGIDMFLQPPGKRVVRMELLSGGEKTLVALSLILSLMDIRPSPFSLMDEIDAPLDDANIGSLMEIIKGISKKTQIVFITHNRITMESSDTIYGITMEDEGISKVVSVRL